MVMTYTWKQRQGANTERVRTVACQNVWGGAAASREGIMIPFP